MNTEAQQDLKRFLQDDDEETEAQRDFKRMMQDDEEEAAAVPKDFRTGDDYSDEGNFDPEAMGMGAARGYTAGIAPYAVSAGAGLIKKLTGMGYTYDEAKKILDKKIAELRERSPSNFLAGEVGGAAVSPIARVLGASSSALKLGEKIGRGFYNSKNIDRAIGLGGELGIMGAADNPDMPAIGAASSIALGTAGTAGLKAAGAGLSKSAQALSRGLFDIDPRSAKMISEAGPFREQLIDFLKNPRKLAEKEFVKEIKNAALDRLEYVQRLARDGSKKAESMLTDEKIIPLAKLETFLIEDLANKASGNPAMTKAYERAAKTNLNNLRKNFKNQEFISEKEMKQYMKELRDSAYQTNISPMSSRQEKLSEVAEQDFDHFMDSILKNREKKPFIRKGARDEEFNRFIDSLKDQDGKPFVRAIPMPLSPETIARRDNYRKMMLPVQRNMEAVEKFKNDIMKNNKNEDQLKALFVRVGQNPKDHTMITKVMNQLDDQIPNIKPEDRLTFLTEAAARARDFVLNKKQGSKRAVVGGKIGGFLGTLAAGGNIAGAMSGDPASIAKGIILISGGGAIGGIAGSMADSFGGRVAAKMLQWAGSSSSRKNHKIMGPLSQSLEGITGKLGPEIKKKSALTLYLLIKDNPELQSIYNQELSKTLEEQEQ